MTLAGPIGPRLGVPRLPLIGTVLTLPGAVAAELLSDPYDVVWIDLEHGALGRAEAQEMILGAQATGALALVRIGLAAAAALVGPMLDAGADGIVAADVCNPDEVAWLVSQMRYPPQGRRGYGPRRSLLCDRSRPTTHQDPQLWVQLESQTGVAAADDIARMAGVDALVVGIADLCVDLGIPIGLTDPRLHDALRTVSTAAEKRRARFGLAGTLHRTEQLGDVLAAASVLVHSTDARLCAAAVDSTANTLREDLQRALVGVQRTQKGR
jgi:4-hydroxy-2-oxoheptanedioate aldolase